MVELPVAVSEAPLPVVQVKTLVVAVIFPLDESVEVGSMVMVLDPVPAPPDVNARGPVTDWVAPDKARVPLLACKVVAVEERLPEPDTVKPLALLIVRVELLTVIPP